MCFLSTNFSLISIPVALVGLAYPFAVYFGLGALPPGFFVILALTLIVARLFVVNGRTEVGRHMVVPLIGVGLLTGLSALYNRDLSTKLYPVAMSLGMALAFGLSLLRPPTLVEAFAALAGHVITPDISRYLRKVTIIWCVFLLGNGAASAATVMSGDLRIWTLYNGLLSYLLMGTLAGGEYAVRCWLKRRAVSP